MTYLFKNKITKKSESIISKHEFTGVIFIVASMFFILANELTLLNQANNTINNFVLFGSVLYTIAGGIQLHHVIKMDWSLKSTQFSFWLIFVQFIGMILFDGSALLQMNSITGNSTWLFNLMGCIFFVISGVLFSFEQESALRWLPNLNWRSITTVVNLWGCVLFLASAILLAPWWADNNACFFAAILVGLIGAVCFIIAGCFYFIKPSEKWSIRAYTFARFPLKQKVRSLWNCLKNQLLFPQILLQEEHDY